MGVREGVLEGPLCVDGQAAGGGEVAVFPGGEDAALGVDCEAGVGGGEEGRAVFVC